MPLRLAALEVHALDQLDVDALVVFVAEDERPLWGLSGLVDWRLNGGLSRLVETGALSGRAGETLLSVTRDALPPGRLFAFGLGEQAKVTPESFAQVAERSAAAAAKANAGRLAIGLPELPRTSVSARLVARAFAAHPADVLLVGDLQELALALPEAAKRG